MCLSSRSCAIPGPFLRRLRCQMEPLATCLFSRMAVHAIAPARLTYWAVVSCAADIRLWRSKPIPAQASTFRVLVQGSTPGPQTVPRADLAAVVWTTRWLASQPSVPLISTLTPAMSWVFGSVDNPKIEPSPARATWTWWSSWLYPLSAVCTRLSLITSRFCRTRKPAPLCFAAAGSHAADAAAKAARDAEMELVAGYADEVAAAHQSQQDYMELFADYLVKLSCAS